MDEAIRNGWARASVRIAAADVEQLPIPVELRARAERVRNPRVMSFVIHNPDEIRLEDLLVEMKGFLREHERTLAGLPNIEMDLFLGWAPKSPQESLTMDAELIAILGRLNASVVFDTYSE